MATQNGFSAEPPVSRKDHIHTAIETKYSLMLQRYIVNQDDRRILHSFYEVLQKAVLAQDQSAEHPIHNEINVFVSCLERSQITGPQSDNFFQALSIMRTGVPLSPNNRIPSIPGHVDIISQPLSQ